MEPSPHCKFEDVRGVASCAIPLPVGGLLETSFGGARHAQRYLGQYTHRVAIFNIASSHSPMAGHFRWRDSAHHNKKRLTSLPVDEFLRRFLLHVLPPGFVRIRHFGFLPHRRRGVMLPLCLNLLAASETLPAEVGPAGKLVPHLRCGLV